MSVRVRIVELEEKRNSLTAYGNVRAAKAVQQEIDKLAEQLETEENAGGWDNERSTGHT
jgi:hypothetical protein